MTQDVSHESLPNQWSVPIYAKANPSLRANSLWSLFSLVSLIQIFVSRFSGLIDFFFFPFHIWILKIFRQKF